MNGCPKCKKSPNLVTLIYVVNVTVDFKAVVLAQLVERLLPIPEVHNSVISKVYIGQLFIVNCIERTKIKKKRPGMEQPVYSHSPLKLWQCVHKQCESILRPFAKVAKFEVFGILAKTK